MKLRTVFLASHVTAEVKQALRKESQDTGKSMSLIVSELLEQRYKLVTS